jgi:sugar phosphate isomerase/epimerase
MKVSRRKFMETSAGAAAWTTIAAGSLRADPLGMPVGTQSWPVRELIGQDFPGTMKKLAGVGYRRIEMCSPAGYKDLGFGGLAKMKGSEVRRVIEDAGMGCESCHFGFTELKGSLDDRIAWSKEMGLKQMIVSTFAVPDTATLDDWRRACDEMNHLGERIGKAGLQAGYHNHDFEFRKYGDVLVYDDLMKHLDPKLVKMQFQVAVISLGYKAQDFFTKFPGRFISMHCNDWSPAEKKAVPIGKGVVDWKGVFTAAKKGGVKNYFVEVDDVQQTIASYPYVHALKV